MKKLSKTHFKNYLSCPNEFWLSIKHPEVVVKPPDAGQLFFFNQGREVEAVFQEYLEGKADQDYEFQKTVETDDLIARFDVFVLKAEDGGAHIYEVKSWKYASEDDSRSRLKQTEAAYDLGFQVYAAEQAGIKVSKSILVWLNPDYILAGELNPESFFVLDDMTNEVEELQSDIGEMILAANELLEGEPTVDLKDVCGKKADCEFIRWKFPELPEYTVFNIPRLNKVKRDTLLDMGVVDLVDVPTDFELTKIQREYVEFITSGGIEIKVEEIRSKLGELVYPLYFLDYESVSPAIPQFEGMHPFEHIVFQYSVHVQTEKGGEAKHYEFLSDGAGVVPEELCLNLRDVIGEKGSIVVWYKGFEMARNRELAALYPDFSNFFESVNERVFDLYEIFSKKLYRDPEFGSNSLKNVLPVMVPHLSYDDMPINNGVLASAQWYATVFRGDDEQLKAETMKALRDYCEQDTLAMVEILRVLELI